MRGALLVALVLALGAPAAAQEQAPLIGSRLFVAQSLPFYGFRNVDVRELSSIQVQQVALILSSKRSETDKRVLIRSALGRGLLGGLVVRF